MMRPITIAVLGAESTGKSTLVQALTDWALGAGVAAQRVPEQLRLWCAQQGRTPRREEQAGVAALQALAIETAQGALAPKAPPAIPAQEAPTALSTAATARSWIVVDTTPLQVAIYSQYVFKDDGLLPGALRFHQQHVDVTLLMGLDLPWVADGLQRDGAHAREPVDTLLRAALQQGGIDHALIYGQGPQRLLAARRALAQRGLDSFGDTSNLIANHQDSTLATGQKDSKMSDEAPPEARWAAWCERCGDPDCERRLFRALATQASESHP